MFAATLTSSNKDKDNIEVSDDGSWKTTHALSPSSPFFRDD